MRQVKFGQRLTCAFVMSFCLAAGSLVAGSGPAGAAETAKSTSGKQPGTTVELFAGVKAGQIEVKFIPKDSTQGRMFIKNKTDKPLRVELPKAAGAVPILAQMGGMGGGMGGMGGMGGGMMQSMGMGGGGMGGGGMGGGGMGGGMFNVAAEKVAFNVAPNKVAEVKVPCVCLDHGKAEPRPTVTYELRPIELVTTKPGVSELCSMLGQLPQRSAQAAAWHLNSGMSWQQLADKQIQYADGGSEPYFESAELNLAMAAANSALKAAESKPKTEPPVTSPGESVSQAR